MSAEQLQKMKNEQKYQVVQQYHPDGTPQDDWEMECQSSEVSLSRMMSHIRRRADGATYWDSSASAEGDENGH